MKKIISAFLILQLVFVSFTFSGCHKNTTLNDSRCLKYYTYCEDSICDLINKYNKYCTVNYNDTYKIARRISSRVLFVSAKTPWESKCLVQALTAQKLLKNQGISTTIYLGVRKEGNEMKAHAWLRCGEYYVTGGAIREQYTVVARFAN